MPYDTKVELPEKYAGIDVERSAVDGTLCLSVDSTQIQRCMECFEELGIDELSINFCRGYASRDISFLREFTSVKSLNLGFPLGFPRTGAFDISPLYELSGLESLRLREPVAFDLARFPQLRSFYGCWHPKLILDGCDGLKILGLWSYKSKSGDLSGLPTLPALRDLTLVQSRVPSLSGLQRWSHLVSLEVSYFIKIESIAEIACLAELRDLEIDTCSNIKDHEVLRSLRNLRTLKLSSVGNIKSLSFLNEMPPLDFISFVRTNVVDGGMTPLFRHKKAGFTSKRHFSHTHEQVAAIHAKRQSTK